MGQTLHPGVEQARLARASNVLCVDADDTSRLLIAEILYDHEVDFALTADDAVQLARSRHYDLCFVDPAVPGFADVDLLAELRVFDTRVPIVICGAREPALGDRAGIRARLLKPLSAERSATSQHALCGVRDRRLSARLHSVRGKQSCKALL